MNISEYLNQHKIAFETHKHRPAFTAQQMAAAEHISGQYVAKPVIIKADEQYYMCVLPACYKIDLEELRRQLGAEELKLASENEMAQLFPECELGAEPPFGTMFGLTTLMDRSLEPDKFIVCQSGKHDEAIRLTMSDYQKLEHPRILSFSYHLH